MRLNRAIGLFILLLVYQNGYSANLIKNSGFETDQSPWFKWKNSDQVTHSISLSKLSGSRFASLRAVGGSSGSWAQVIPNIQPESYTLSVWARSNGELPKSSLQIKGIKNHEAIFDKTWHISNEHVWTHHQFAFEVTEKIDKLLVVLFLTGDGDVWFDDVVLDKTENVEIQLDGVWQFRAGNYHEKVSVENSSIWSAIIVPGFWEDQGFPDLEGFAWYKKQIDIPDAMLNKTLLFEAPGIARVDEVFFNGIKIGQMGRHPPELIARTSDHRRYIIPTRLLRSKNNVLTIRVNDGQINNKGGLWKKGVKIRVADPYEFLAVSVTSDSIGNIFSVQDKIKLTTTIANEGSQDIVNSIATLTILNSQREVIAEKKISINIPTDENLAIVVGDYNLGIGLYYFSISIHHFENEKIPVSYETTFGVLNTTNRSMLQNNSAFGVAAHLNRLNNKEFEATINLMSRVGIRWVRTGFLWKDLELVKDQFNWERFDRTMLRSTEKGINILATLAIAPRWAIKNSQLKNYNDVSMPELEPWKHYVSSMVSRYADRCNKCQLYEIWNEPNLSTYMKPSPNSHDYHLLLSAAYDAAKIASTEARILSAGLAPVSLMEDKYFSDHAFLNELYTYADDKLTFDVIGYHPYPKIYRDIPNSSIVDDTEKLLSRIKAVSRHHQDRKRTIINTETSCASTSNDINEVRQAECLLVLLVTSSADQHVEKTFWYNFRDSGNNKHDREHNYGLLHHDFTPKPTLYAFMYFLENISDKRHYELVKLPTGQVIHKYLGDGNKEVWVTWSDSPIQYDVPDDVHHVRSMMNFDRALVEGSLEIDSSPSYIFFR